MANEVLITPFGIEQRIFAIRGAQVMIDRDLAHLYGVEPKRLGEQVRRNIDRFPDAFRFQLTEAEKNELVANCDRSSRSSTRPCSPMLLPNRASPCFLPCYEVIRR